MFYLFASVLDSFPSCVAENFSECAHAGEILLKDRPDIDSVFIFHEEDGSKITIDFNSRLAGMVTKREQIEFKSKQSLFFAIEYKTVFGHTNSSFCMWPSIPFVCQKLKQYNNWILGVSPITAEEFYKSMDVPLPF